VIVIGTGIGVDLCSVSLRGINRNAFFIWE